VTRHCGGSGRSDVSIRTTLGYSGARGRRARACGPLASIPRARATSDKTTTTTTVTKKYLLSTTDHTTRSLVDHTAAAAALTCRSSSSPQSYYTHTHTCTLRNTLRSPSLNMRWSSVCFRRAFHVQHGRE